MVDYKLYIQQLTYNNRKKSDKIKELYAENAKLKLDNSSLNAELERLSKILKDRNIPF